MLYIPESTMVTLNEITAFAEENQYSFVSIKYSIGSGSIIISIIPLYDDNAVYFDEVGNQITDISIGKLFMWNSGDYIQGRIYYKTFEIDLSSTLSEEEFIYYCKLLAIID